MNQRLIDVAACAAYLGVKESHVRGLVYRRQIPHTHVGRRLRFDLRELDRWIAENSTEAESA